MGSVAVLGLAVLAVAACVAALLFFLKTERALGKKHHEVSERARAELEADQPANGRVGAQAALPGNGRREATKQLAASQPEKEQRSDSNPTPTPAQPGKV